MRAVCLHEHGGIDSLTLEENFPDPVADEGHVVIRVGATSLNYHDVFTCQGMPGIKVPMPMIIGLDVAGTITEIGPGVDGWSVGDRVLVNPLDPVEPQLGLMGEMIHGGTAELCRVNARRLIAMPDGVSFAQAAALPVAYGSAHRMMVTHGKVAEGEKVLIPGRLGRRRIVLRAGGEDGGRRSCRLRVHSRQARGPEVLGAPITSSTTRNRTSPRPSGSSTPSPTGAPIPAGSTWW